MSGEKAGNRGPDYAVVAQILVAIIVCTRRQQPPREKRLLTTYTYTTNAYH